MNVKAKNLLFPSRRPSGWLELNCWRPNSRGGCGFQDYAFGIGLGPVLLSRAQFSAWMQTISRFPR